MSKFNYRMQNIFELYQKLENEAKITLTMANNALAAEQEKLAKIHRDIFSYEERIRGQSEQILDINELKRCNEAIAVKKIQAESQKKNIEKAQKRVDAAMNKLTEVMKDRKTQENLREKAFDEFMKDENAHESKETDEMVSYRFNEAKDLKEAD